MERKIKKFLRWWYRNNIPALICLNLLETEDVINVLEHLSVLDPKKRKKDVWDDKFIQLIPVLHNYPEALTFINRYGHVCDTYFKNIVAYNPHLNAELQYKLCEVQYSEQWHPCYDNLLREYQKRYSLLPKVIEKLKKEPKYRCIIPSYFD